MENFKENDFVFLQKKGAKKPSTFREVVNDSAIITSLRKTKHNTLITSHRFFRNYEDFRSSKYVRRFDDPLIQEIFKRNEYKQNFLHVKMKVMLKDSNKIFVIKQIKEDAHQMHYINNMDLFKGIKVFVLDNIFLPHYADELVPLPNPNDILKGILNDKG